MTADSATISSQTTGVGERLSVSAQHFKIFRIFHRDLLGHRDRLLILAQGAKSARIGEGRRSVVRSGIVALFPGLGVAPHIVWRRGQGCVGLGYGAGDVIEGDGLAAREAKGQGGHRQQDEAARHRREGDGARVPTVLALEHGPRVLQ